MFDLQLETSREYAFSCVFFADGIEYPATMFHGARQWADGGTRPTNSLMRLSMGTLRASGKCSPQTEGSTILQLGKLTSFQRAIASIANC